MATWMPLSRPSRIPQSRVLLAVWPGLRGDCSGVAAVTELHAALRLATVVLDRLTD
ncbi:hypothetical protein [Streptomyces sp. HC307]|uniref:hypothetical protein n=1 Tax=Streptomyces flavusporus TaxID=3385496 RepID=UPI0039176634